MSAPVDMAARLATAFPLDDRLPDGVHLGLREDTTKEDPTGPAYFAHRALGSSDAVALHLYQEGWWWSSWLNPDRPPRESSDAMNFGKLLHAITLEGLAAYESRAAVLPDKRDFPGLVVTVDDIVAKLTKEGYAPTQKKPPKPEVSKRLAELFPKVPQWDVIMADFHKANEGRVPVTKAEDRQLRLMAASVHDHPTLGPLFQFGPDNLPLPEVSIFWTDQDGIRWRSRLDLMLPLTTFDLKALGNWGGQKLNFAVGERMARLALDVQMALYHRARRQAYQAILEGRVFGGTPEERAWLARFPKDAPHWNWCWLFHQRPEESGRAPILFPVVEPMGSDLHRYGVRKLFRARETFLGNMAKFGPATPWTRVDPVHVTAETEKVHRVFLPHWVADDVAVPDEDQDLSSPIFTMEGVGR